MRLLLLVVIEVASTLVSTWLSTLRGATTIQGSHDYIVTVLFHIQLILCITCYIYAIEFCNQINILSDVTESMQHSVGIPI